MSAKWNFWQSVTISWARKFPVLQYSEQLFRCSQIEQLSKTNSSEGVSCSGFISSCSDARLWVFKSPFQNLPPFEEWAFF